MNKHVREFAKKVEPIGWTCDGKLDGNGHYIFAHTDGNEYRVPSTPSEHRSLKNCLSDLERLAGQRTMRVVRKRSRKAPERTDFSISGAKHEQRERLRINRLIAAHQLELDEVLEAQRRIPPNGNQVFLRRLINEQQILRVRIDDLKDQLYDLTA